MVVGICRLRLHLPGTTSLKGKRQVIKSIVNRVQNAFNVSIAEVADQDLWQSAWLGIACVSTDRAHADEVLNRVISFIERARVDAELGEYEIELIDA